jgi:Xaa-Pro aminopeptidase
MGIVGSCAGNEVRPRKSLLRELKDKFTPMRTYMNEVGIDAYVVFHADAHNSEYIAPCDERISYISGFTGSNGVCVITQTAAKLWTDGRYYLAAENQLEEGWTMEKMESGVPQWAEWITINVGEGKSVGWDFATSPASLCEDKTAEF